MKRARGGRMGKGEESGVQIKLFVFCSLGYRHAECMASTTALLILLSLYL